MGAWAQRGRRATRSARSSAAEIFLKVRPSGARPEILVKKTASSARRGYAARPELRPSRPELYGRRPAYERAEHMYLQAKNKARGRAHVAAAATTATAAAYFTEIASPKEAGEHLEKDSGRSSRRSTGTRRGASRCSRIGHRATSAPQRRREIGSRPVEGALQQDLRALQRRQGLGRYAALLMKRAKQTQQGGMNQGGKPPERAEIITRERH